MSKVQSTEERPTEEKAMLQMLQREDIRVVSSDLICCPGAHHWTPTVTSLWTPGAVALIPSSRRGKQRWLLVQQSRPRRTMQCLLRVEVSHQTRPRQKISRSLHRSAVSCSRHRHLQGRPKRGPKRGAGHQLLLQGQPLLRQQMLPALPTSRMGSIPAPSPCIVQCRRQHQVNTDLAGCSVHTQLYCQIVA